MGAGLLDILLMLTRFVPNVLRLQRDLETATSISRDLSVAMRRSERDEVAMRALALAAFVLAVLRPF